MTMTYDGALVMPSSYAVMNEEEMTYVDGGLKFVTTYKYSNAKTYINACKILCRVAAVAGYIDAGLTTAASSGLACLFAGVGLSCVGSTMWSWADAYGNARMDLNSLSSKKRVQITVWRK